jgi:hypothetical protein
MEAICSSETSVLIRATRRHLPEDDNHHSHRRGNLKSYLIGIRWVAYETYELYGRTYRKTRTRGLSLVYELGRRRKQEVYSIIIIIIIISGVGLSPLGTAATNRPIVQAPDVRWGWLWSNWWNEDWQGKPKYSEKSCPSATLSTTIPHA